MNARLRFPFILVPLAATHLAAFLLAMGPRQPAPAAATSGTSEQASQPVLPAKSSWRDSGSHTQLWRKLRETDLPRADFERARNALLADWARRDLVAVLGLVYGPESANRFDRHALFEVLYEEIARQPAAVLEWIRAGRFGSNRVQVYRTWLHSLGERREYALILASWDGTTPSEQEAAISQLAGAKDASILDQARKLLDAIPADNGHRAEMLENYARGRVAFTKGDMSSLFAAEDDPGLRRALANAWLQARDQGDPKAEHFAALGDLPEDVRGPAGASLLERLIGWGESGQLVPALVEMDRLELRSGLADSEVQRGVKQVMGDDAIEPGPALDGLLSLQEASLRHALLEAAGRGLARRDDAETKYALVLEKMPEGPERDACLEGMAFGFMGSGDKDRAREILRMIQDPSRRNATEKSLERWEAALGN